MIDVHCHLADNKFNQDVDDVIGSAISAGIQKIVVVPEFESQFEKVLQLCEKYPNNLFAGIGVHPIQKRGKSVQPKHVSKIEEWVVKNEKRVVCIGEIGLDHTFTQFKLTEEDLKTQEIVFRQQIQLAKHFDKPVNVHSRSAALETINVLKSENIGADRVVLHAFDGSPEEAEIGVKAGFLFSIPPSFVRSEQMRAVIKTIPMNHLLLETDSPALGPEKGARNVPQNAIISAQLISEVKQIPLEDVISNTSCNATRVFNFGVVKNK